MARDPAIRVPLLGVLLLGEGGLLAACYDAAPILGGSGSWWAGVLSRAGIVMPLVTAVVTATALLAGTRLRAELSASVGASDERRSWPWLLGHLTAFAAFFWLTGVIFGAPRVAPPSGWSAGAWALTGVVAMACLVVTAMPVPALGGLARRVVTLLGACAGVGAMAWAAGQVTGEWWYPLGRSTMWAVAVLLHFIVPDAIVVPDQFIVGTEDFRIEIVARCSGYEGIGLIWVFLIVYLWTFRATLRFPHALLLLPLGTAAMWLANVLRITALVWIGSVLSPEVALGGFHANSGSLLLCVVALGFGWAAHRSTFFSRESSASAVDLPPTPVAAYLLPLLLTFTAAMVSGLAGSGTVDQFYFLRVLAAGVALWTFRHEYPTWRWQPSWTPLLAAVTVAVLWIVVFVDVAPGPDPTAAELATLSPASAMLWIVCRFLGGVVTVPIAEELAFRGYLARRLVAHDFHRVAFDRLTWFAVLASSLAFGLLHERFIAGTIAGVVYALVARQRGALVDAVVAHAGTNALLAAWVLATGRWALW